MLLGSGATPAYYIGTHNFKAWQTTTNEGNYMLFKGYVGNSASTTWSAISMTQGRIK
jgi:hypothetical protein